MPPCDSSVRYFLVKIEPPGQQTFSYSPKLNLSTALRGSAEPFHSSTGVDSQTYGRVPPHIVCGPAPCWIVVPLRGETAQHRAKPCPLICPPRPSANMPAAPGQIPPRRSATVWEAPRRTSTVRVRTTVLPKGRSCGKRHPSAPTAATPGGCTTCSATSGSGAAAATHQDLRAASIPGGHP